jgi:diguanylate cyclase (GGDEF)-like protein/PAS domain S-box-containing protein
MSASDSGVPSSRTLAGQFWNALPLAALLLGPRATVQEVNDSARTLLGYAQDDLVGLGVGELLAGERPDVRGAAEALPDPGAADAELETRVRKKDGEAIPVRLSFAQLQPGDAGDVRTLVLLHDLRRVKRAERRYQDLFDHHMAGVFRATTEGTILECNAAAAQMLGYEDPDALVGTVFWEYYRGDGQRLRESRARLEADGELTDWEAPFRRQGGDQLVVLASVVRTTPLDSDDPILIGSFVEVTDQVKLRKELETMAYRDMLTMLPNRRFLDQHAQKLLALADRHDKHVGVAYLDLDDFKEINDRWGHNTGDEVLEAVANRLRRSIREGDVAARIGGDEFVVIWSDLPAARDALRGTRRILKRAGKPLDVDDGPTSVSLSAGVATFPEDGDDLGTLLRCADEAMYAAKNEEASSVQMA